MKWYAKLSAAVAVTTAVSGTAVLLAPGAHAATIRYEAESAPATCGGAVASNHSGYSGSGFCDTTNAVGAAVTFTVNAPAAGKPAAWAGHGISQLQTDVYNYTYDVCNSLKAQGTVPDIVQIGNEINTGMLWDDGRVVNNNFDNLGLLLKAGYHATRACNSSTQVIIHTARVESGARWFYDGIRAQGVQWDITGLSYYCFWHGGMSNMAGVVSDMRSRYGKPVVIAETAYPYTTANADSTQNIVTGGCSGYAVTPAGQQANFAAVQNTARNAGAIGIFYWEPAWYAVPGNGWNPADINNSGNEWDDMAVFDRTGRLNPNIRWLS
jgi:arabinogalactan endo-1,4-beta-galactosidase